jgi:hypothetical protein
MHQTHNVERPEADAISEKVAWVRALCYLRCVGFDREGQTIRLKNTTDYGTHWLFDFGVSSLSDPSRDFLQHSIVVDKTGCVFDFPSRALERIDDADIDSIRRNCHRITLQQLQEISEEALQRVRVPTCNVCDSLQVRFDGGQIFLVEKGRKEFVRWQHTCVDCHTTAELWDEISRKTTVYRCTHTHCKSELRMADRASPNKPKP